MVYVIEEIYGILARKMIVTDNQSNIRLETTSFMYVIFSLIIESIYKYQCIDSRHRRETVRGRMKIICSQLQCSYIFTFCVCQNSIYSKEMVIFVRRHYISHLMVLMKF